MENTGTNEQNVTIKVNTFNRLKKIRAGVVYESVTTVIDEILQNCQRSFIVSETKNPVIDVTAQNDSIIIRDNGKGCADPQSIFEFETSGWEISDAFGQGGSESVFQISDLISIRSRDWRATVNVVEMLETENLQVTVERNEEYFEGYEVMLSGEKILKNISMLSNYISNMMQIFTCDCWFNAEKVEKKDLHAFASPHKEKFNSSFYEATIGVQKGYRDSQIYYEKRKVCDMWLPGIFAIIELKRDAVTLKAPDRKSIIYDDKKTAFTKNLEEDCKLLYLSFVKDASEQDFEEYEYGIDRNLTAQDYADYLPYYNKLEYDQKRGKVLAAEVPSSKTVKERNELDELNRKESNKCYAVAGTPDKVIEAKTEVKESFQSKKANKGEFKSKLGKVLNIVWCEFDRKEELQDLINKAESYGIKVMFSKSKLYGKAFDYWGLPHIEKIMDRTEAKYIIGSPSGYTSSSTERYYRETTKKEERLLNILKNVEQYYGLTDVFRIADVKEHLHLEHDGETVMDTLVKSTSATIRDRQKIYLDRATLNLGKVNITDSKSAVTKFDVLIVMLNIRTIASGLAQILYNTVEKTVDHYNKVDKISKEIAMLLASL